MALVCVSEQLLSSVDLAKTGSGGVHVPVSVAHAEQEESVLTDLSLTYLPAHCQLRYV